MNRYYYYIFEIASRTDDANGRECNQFRDSYYSKNFNNKENAAYTLYNVSIL